MTGSRFEAPRTATPKSLRDEGIDVTIGVIVADGEAMPRPRTDTNLQEAEK